MQIKIKSQLIYLKNRLIEKETLEEVISYIQKSSKTKINVTKILIEYRQYKLVLKKSKEGLLLLKHSKNNYEIILKDNSRLRTNSIYSISNI